MSKEMKQTLKEKIKNAISIKESWDVDGFEELYIIKTRRKHESGYYIFEIYGLKDDKIYTLTRCSDVISFEKANTSFEWFLGIDVPEPSIIRLFVRGKNEKIYVPYRSLSDFTINIY